MEPKGSLQCSQEPSTGPYSESDQIQSIQLHPNVSYLWPFIQRILPVPRPFVTFRNKLFFWTGVLSPTSNPQVGGPPHIGCPRLLIQFILSYSPYLGAFPPGIKGPEREADHSPSTSAEVKKIWLYMSTPPYPVMA
jgi:hypothetical protein